MIVYATAGLLFSLLFLDINKSSPFLSKTVIGLIVSAWLTLSYAFVRNDATLATLISFVVISNYMLLAWILGFYALKHKHANAIYYLAAMTMGSVGVAMTSLATWGIVPFSFITFHAAEIGMMAESTLLALALSAHFRKVQAKGLQAEKMAHLDPLTHLYNRRGFVNALDPVWETICRHQRPASLIMLDLDYFKNLNDTHGHDVGDIALNMVAETLTKHIRTGDIAVRWGGEEFLVFLPETGIEQAYKMAERVRESIAHHKLKAPLATIFLTGSIGVAEKVIGNDNIEQLINNADNALYEAKHEGKNQTKIYEPIEELASGFN
jgi:diguanylate cyclase (GGDEF)-like protein